MKNSYQNITILFLLLATAISFGISLYLTKGYLSFAIHGPYIHFAMAKHLIGEGVLSVDGFSYSSVSSSPLWLFLIAPFYKLLGSDYFAWIALLFNLIPQIIAILTLFKIVKEFTSEALHPIYAILIILITPFLALSFGGLEHSVQIMLITLFLLNMFRFIRDEKDKRSKLFMLILAPFIVAIRYEDIAFIVSVAIMLSLFLKSYRFSASLLLSSLVLVALFGIWSQMSFDLGLLPSSISAKSSDHVSHIKKFFSNIFYAHIIAIIALNIALLFYARDKNRALTISILIFLMTFFTHLAFAQVGWLYRYEAYLNYFGMINIILGIYIFKPEKKILYAVLAILLIGGYKQIFYAPLKSVLSTRAVYEQQIQEGKFSSLFHNYFIATDNIGTIPFYSDDKILDIHGLSDPRIIHLKAIGEFNDRSKKALIRSEKIDLIIAYKNRFVDQKIEGFKKLATWKIKHNILNGDDEVCFWAKKGKIDEVIKKLKSFKVPNDVEVIWQK